MASWGQRADGGQSPRPLALSGAGRRHPAVGLPCTLRAGAQVDGNGAQADLPLHQDGSLVSFNVLLNPATDFEGGGTFFETTATTHLIEQGYALFHCGGLRHAAAPITSGRYRSRFFILCVSA